MRTAFYIDGFNLYHTLNDSQKWLDLRKLAENFIAGNDHIDVIKYFTAYSWNPQKKARHQILTQVYEDQQIAIVLGKFKQKDRRCNACRQNYRTHEEKQTDVNIALHLLNDATHNRYEKAYIVSGDTDLLPAIKMTISEYPEKHFIVILPPRRNANEIQHTCQTEKMTATQINASQLTDPYTTANGKRLRRPKEWN